jgi:hypothetical protein
MRYCITLLMSQKYAKNKQIIEAFCCLPNNSSTLTANFLGTAIGTGFPEKKQGFIFDISMWAKWKNFHNIFFVCCLIEYKEIIIEVIELLTSAAFFCKFLPISLLLIFFFFCGRLGSLGGVAGSSLRPAASGFLASAVGSRRPASGFPDSVPPLEDFEPNFAQVRPL